MSFAFFADCMQHTRSLSAATTFLSLLCDLVTLHKRLVTADGADPEDSEALQFQSSKHALALLQRDWAIGGCAWTCKPWSRSTPP